MSPDQIRLATLERHGEVLMGPLPIEEVREAVRCSASLLDGLSIVEREYLCVGEHHFPAIGD